MKKISLWAKNHVFITRIIIVVIHLLLIRIAFFLCNTIQFNFSFSVFVALALIIIVASMLYPFAKKISYPFQKIILFITSTCFFLITCFFIKDNFISDSFQKTFSAVSVPVDSLKNATTLTRSQKHVLKKELRTEIKAYKKIPRPQRPTAQDALLILFIVLSGIGLLCGLGILVCGISCGGIPALVLISVSAGMGGIGVGLYFIIRKLHKNVEKERKQSQTNSFNNADVLSSSLIMT
ncbi:MAG: hypothetical protein ABJB05_08585 [Parafilimonas sp.]